MGRFKIYDPEKLVSVEDSNYGKCLLCERKLKNIMGNIKRHYEQMHSLYVDRNGRESKKGQSNTSKLKRNNITTGKRTSDDISVHKSDKAKQFQTSTISLLPICHQHNNNLNVTPVKNLPKDPQKNEQSDQIMKTADITQQIQGGKPFKVEPQNVETKPRNMWDHQLPTDYSDAKKVRLVEENGQIQIPCYSFINNIQINAVESCNQLEFLKCLVETKAYVNIPLKTFQNEGTFQNSLQNWKPNFQFNYSPHTIGDHIDRMAKNLRQEIKKLVANRLIYLKLDIASSTEANVMLVNIQFINDFKLKVITLNALELPDDDLAAYLKKKVMSTLERYRIEISNVFSIIKDNTNNVRKYTKNSEKMFEYTNNTEYCQHLSHGFPGHAIHFAACDIITQLNENISQSRDSARNLQKKILQSQTKSTMLFDYNTNWFSVYDMIERLVNFHDEITDKSLLLFDIEADWVFAKKFVESFKPVVETALILQTSEIAIMGDFYREWLLCEIKLEELAVKNELALYLLKAFHKRKLEFLENSSVLAALYMDPRFCYMGSMHLSDKQKEIAIVQLIQIFNKLKSIQGNTTCSYHTNNSKIQINDRYDKLERQINNNVKTNNDAVNVDEVSISYSNEERVKESLEQLQFEERLVLKTNILEYWNVVNYKNPTLAKLAEIALAAPATQATLTRILNVSSITSLKSKLNENIKNLLLLKLNHDLVDKISLEN